MSLEKVKEYFKQYNMEGRIIEFDVSSATSTLAAEAIGCGVEQIAKTLAFKDGESCSLLGCSGAVKTDNKKFKETFGFKAKMLTLSLIHI